MAAQQHSVDGVGVEHVSRGGQAGHDARGGRVAQGPESIRDGALFNRPTLEGVRVIVDDQIGDLRIGPPHSALLAWGALAVHCFERYRAARMSDADRDKWDAIHARADGVGTASPWLVSIIDRLPKTGRALDIAGGRGANAIALRERGLDVTLVDISRSALQRAADADPGLNTMGLDLEVAAVPLGPWDLVLCFNYLQRALFASISERLATGGHLVVNHPTQSNLQRNPKPSARFLLRDGELPTLVEGLEVVSYEEGWFGQRHEARLIAVKRRP